MKISDLKLLLKTIAVWMLWGTPLQVLGQSNINHWETVIYNTDEWSYFKGDSAPPAGWYNTGFPDSSWSLGAGGIGYGDGDDNTIISSVTSVYLRKEFEIIRDSSIDMAILHADYDDAFVAYLNGIEIARSNIGTKGLSPAYNETASDYHEASMYQGGLPEAYIIDGSLLSQLLTNGTNTLAVQVHNQSQGSSDLSAIFFLSLAINDDSRYYRTTPDWFEKPFFSSNLPILVFNTNDQSILRDTRIVAEMGIIDNGPDQQNYLSDPFNGYNGKISIETRGSSSEMFPKKNYGFETQDATGNNFNTMLLGLPPENDWVLHGPYSDKSLMRNVLSYYIGSHIIKGYTPRTRWCELVINSDYRGLYVLTEQVKRDKFRVDIAKLNPADTLGDELTGGYIFQIDRHDPGIDDGFYSAFRPGVFYAYHDPDYDELVPLQKEYLKDYISEFESAMNTGVMSTLYSRFVDVESFIDYWIATEIYKHIDAFKLSFYMYKKKDSNGGRIHFGPLWDLNLTFGNFNIELDPAPQGWSYKWTETSSIHPFWIMKLLSIPDIKNSINCRWMELRSGSLQTNNLLNYIDSTAAYIEEASVRNFTRWPVLGEWVWPNDFVGVDYEDELWYLKYWLETRLDWMDANMVGECLLNTSGEMEITPGRISVYPNPFQDEVTFYNPGQSIEEGTITILNSAGEQIISERMHGEASITLSLGTLARGIYFYKIVATNQYIITGKLIKL